MARSEKRYVLRLAIFMSLYIALLWPVTWATRHGHVPQGWPLYAAAMTPALPVLGAIWAMLRFLSEEEDEYRRFIRVQAFIWGAGLAVAVMTAWGFLEEFAKVAPMPPMYPFLIFVCAIGFAQGIGAWWRR